MHYPQFCQKASGEFCHPTATVFVIALLTTLFCLLSIQWLDLPLTLWMAQQKENLPVLQSFFKFVTMFGKGVALIAPALAMVLVLWWLDRRAHQPLAKGINKFLSEKKLLDEKRRKLWLRWSVLFLAAMVVSGILVNVLKFLIGRPRPELWFSQGSYGFDPLALHHAWHSLPSGHSTTAGALEVFVWQAGGIWRYAALLYALLIAASRLVLLQHYLADVVAGLVFGALVSWLLLRRYRPAPSLSPNIPSKS
jgi:membrane-associated phospholipid phosphatase